MAFHIRTLLKHRPRLGDCKIVGVALDRQSLADVAFLVEDETSIGWHDLRFLDWASNDPQLAR
jgi:hypothetical protein